MARTRVLALIAGMLILALPAAASAGVKFDKIVFDPPGTGDSNKQLNKELVIVKNNGNDGVDISGWSVNAPKAHYTFHDVFLDAGESVTLHTGKGTDTQHKVYWGRHSDVWPDTKQALATLWSDAPNSSEQDSCIVSGSTSTKGYTNC